MKGTYVGEFEEVVLLAVALCYGQAYGAAIVSELEKQMKRPVNLGAVHTALNRLAEKGLVISQMGGVTAKRGGRRKRLYAVTVAGSATLQEIQGLRKGMWELIPIIALP